MLNPPLLFREFNALADNAKLKSIGTPNLIITKIGSYQYKLNIIYNDIPGIPFVINFIIVNDFEKINNYNHIVYRVLVNSDNCINLHQYDYVDLVDDVPNVVVDYIDKFKKVNSIRLRNFYLDNEG